MIAANGFWFARGEPGSDDPQPIRGDDGRPFVLPFDFIMRQLAPRVPGAVR